MLKKSVAVVDIRSSEITAVVAERGVNNTFIIKCKFSAAYDGYAEGSLIDTESFESALRSVVKSINLASGEKIKTIYIGVPGEFTELVNAESSLSFPVMKRVRSSDIKALEKSATPEARKGWQLIRCGCLYYVLSDKRRTVNPLGRLSDSISGRLCFYYCEELFAGIVRNSLSTFKNLTEIIFIPAVHAEAIYLIPPEQRDDYSILLDFGYISSTYTVVCGNGVAYTQSFSLGAGHLAVYLMETLGMTYDAAVSMMSRVNLNSKNDSDITLEYVSGADVLKYSDRELKEKIGEALDGICEAIEECSRGFIEKDLGHKPINITGECIKTVRGAIEHICGRLVRTINVVSPAIPYYDKPQFSSLFSLLDMALSDKEKTSFLGLF